MNNITNFDNCEKKLVGEVVGTISISVYKDIETGLSFFYVKPENENVLQVSYIIEDVLYKY